MQKRLVDGAGPTEVVNDDRPVVTSMQGAGFYNEHSDYQAAGISMALPLVEEAARSVPVDGNGPLVIADYGSSQGRNSMRPMCIAIDAMRARAKPDAAVEVIHTDLPSNDFTSLFCALQDEPQSYLRGRANIFVSAVGRSYFEPVIPAGRVHLGWNSWTLQWMSRNPVDVSDHAFAMMSSSASAREAVAKQLAQDWEQFLRMRSLEMRKGAKLVTLTMGRLPERHGWQEFFDTFWECVLDMRRDGLLSADEQRRLTIPVATRSADDLEKPFRGGRFAGLSLEHATVVDAPDPYWSRYLETRDAETFGRSWSVMIRAAAGPTAATALEPGRDQNAFLDDLFRRFATRLASAPKPYPGYLTIAVVRKDNSG